MAYTTDDLKACFEDAFDLWVQQGAGSVGDFRDLIRAGEVASNSLLNPAGTLTTASSGGRTSSIVFDARIPGSVTTKEQANLRRDLLERIERWAAFIQDCYTYGLDPLITERTGAPNPLPSQVQNPAPLTMWNLAEWMLGSNWARFKTGFAGVNLKGGWPSHLFYTNEYMSDYTCGRTAGVAYV